MRTLLDRVDEARGLYSPAFQEVHADEAIVDRDGGFRAWRDLNASLPLAPLFPASDLAHWIAKLTPLLIDHPDFEERTSELDRFVAERAGRSSQGDAAWERAKTLVAAGQYLKALGHCHKMLGGRWSGDDPAGGLSALLILSRLYSTLHLHLAGKQYALAAAYGAGSLGLPEVQEFIPRGLLRAAECEYKSGAWCNAVDLLDVGIASAQHYLLGGFNPEEAPEQPAGLALMAIMSCALHIPGLREKIDERLGDPLVLPVAESIGAVLAEAPLTMSIDEWSELTDSQLDGRPFSDLGPHRMIRFSAHGILWMVSGSTAYRSARALERFVANLQVVLADLSSHELVLLAGPMLVEIVVELREPAETRAPVTISSQLDRRKVTVLLTESVSTSEGGPEIADPEAVATETLAAVVLILQSVSCLPGDELLAANRIAMENGLGTKITVGRPFDELEFIDEASYGLLERGTFPSLFSPSDAVVHDGIPPTVAPGPKYSKAEAEDSIRRRYEILPPLIPLTIERLRADPQFAAVVEELRELGWRDWHILLAVHVRATNVRAAAEGLLGLPNPSDVQRERFVEIGRTPEVNELDALPPADFSTGSLRLSLIAGFPLVLQSYGLRLPGAVNEESLSRFLERRYNYFSDDVPHAAIWEGGEGTGG